MTFDRIGTEQFLLLILGAFLSIILPSALALFWKFKKKERFTTVLIGAGVFLVFAIFLEKMVQNVLIFPTEMGLPDHAVSQFVNARPILWAFIVGLFPGVFEETGRFVAFKTLLRNRKNKETAISYGIGHGGFEVIFIIGLTFISYISYAIMINNGTYGDMVAEVAAQAPSQTETAITIAQTLSTFGFADLGIIIIERIFAVIFHISASVLVFYACKDRKKIWLYPLAIILHTALDCIAGLNIKGLFTPSPLQLEGIIGIFSLTVGALALTLYLKDKNDK